MNKKINELEEFLASEVKKYKIETDYKFREQSNGFKTYTLISTKLQKSAEDFLRKERGCWTPNPNREKPIVIDFGEFDNAFFGERKFTFKDWETKRHEISHKRKEFIFKNNPPQFQKNFCPDGLFIDPNNPKNLHNWWAKQPAFTDAELTALNDPVLEWEGDWNETLWFIQFIRRANDPLFTDEDFWWSEKQEKEINDPNSNRYKGAQALKNAGISLKKLKQRGLNGKRIREEYEQGKPVRDKAKILNNLNDWIVNGPNAIYNLKTNQALIMEKNGNMTKFRSYLEPADCQNEHETIEDAFDKTTFKELRAAIFANFKKNLQENKNLPKLTEKDKELAKDAYQKENFTEAEWKQIEKEVEKVKQSLSNSEKTQSPKSSPKLIIWTGISLIVLVIVGLLILKKKRNSRKK